ncbi:MAG: F0F1 ATP synthase subunit epsilon [Proteobacteria bacterium]|nr:F0F1 ATP synthase subunit epsilon [Pseudomonadota bacterium]
MNTFVLHLQSGTQYERIEDATSFVGVDASGSFGILAGHARMMTCLASGLARFQKAGGMWRHLAHPGAVLYFAENQLYLSTRRYLHDAEYTHISAALRSELLAEEEKLLGMRESLKHLEDEMLKRMWGMQRDMRGML